MRLLVSCLVFLELFICGNGHLIKLLPDLKGMSRDRIANDPVIVNKILDRVQYYHFQYFWDGAEPNSGLARERYHSDGVYPQNDRHVVTSGGAGFGLMAALVALERGWVTRAEVARRLRRGLSFLERADRFHGAWPHWMHGETGRVVPFSEKDDGGDLVETAYLVQGLLVVREYYKLKSDATEDERWIVQKADELWRGVEWSWYRNGNKNVLYWHWSPKYGWAMDFAIEGWNECLILYVMAACSPTYGIPAEVYHKGWARNGNMVNTADDAVYGIHLRLKHNYAPRFGGPLFWAHYSFLGLDPRGLVDRYADYWQHNVNHTLINREWCVRNNYSYRGYGRDTWGLTSSYSMLGYAGHKPKDEDLGVISPTAALSSMPYTPNESLDVLLHFALDLSPRIWGEFGFYDAFSEHFNWYLPRYLAIDQGPVVAMLENYRSALLWRLFMHAPEVREGLTLLGFTSPNLPLPLNRDYHARQTKIAC